MHIILQQLEVGTRQQLWSATGIIVLGFFSKYPPSEDSGFLAAKSLLLATATRKKSLSVMSGWKCWWVSFDKSIKSEIHSKKAEPGCSMCTGHVKPSQRCNLETDEQL